MAAKSKFYIEDGKVMFVSTSTSGEGRDIQTNVTGPFRADNETIRQFPSAWRAFRKNTKEPLPARKRGKVWPE